MLQSRQVSQMAESVVREPFRAAQVERCYVTEPADALHQGVGHLAFGVQTRDPVLLHSRNDGVPNSHAADRLLESSGSYREEMYGLRGYSFTAGRHRADLLRQGLPVLEAQRACEEESR